MFGQVADSIYIQKSVNDPQYLLEVNSVDVIEMLVWLNRRQFASPAAHRPDTDNIVCSPLNSIGLNSKILSYVLAMTVG